MHIFAVTYTYNDAALTNALLSDMLRWPVRPATVLVVDDGSEPAYAFPPKLRDAYGTAAPQILRLTPNQGPGRAKRAGINAAAASDAEVILSLDADIRPHPAWLRAALPYLADPGIGLVGAEFMHGLGGDSLSRYLRAFFTPRPDDAAVGFLRAGLWLLRRDIWLDMDGLDSFGQPTHEDLYFCRKLNAAGLRLQAVNSKPVSQVRRLHRHAYMRRELTYLGFAIHKVAQRSGLESALQPLVRQTSTRLTHILAQNEAEFLYLEIFKYAALLAWLQKDSITPSLTMAIEKLLSCCLSALTPYPNTRALLYEDLTAIGLRQACPPRASACPPPSPLPGPEELHHLLLKLEVYGIKKLNAEQRTVPFDSHYLSSASI